MKKFILYLVTAVLALSLFACGSKETEQEDANTVASNEETAETSVNEAEIVVQKEYTAEELAVINDVKKYLYFLEHEYDGMEFNDIVITNNNNTVYRVDDYDISLFDYSAYGAPSNFMKYNSYGFSASYGYSFHNLTGANTATDLYNEMVSSFGAPSLKKDFLDEDGFFAYWAFDNGKVLVLQDFGEDYVLCLEGRDTYQNYIEGIDDISISESGLTEVGTTSIEPEIGEATGFVYISDITPVYSRYDMSDLNPSDFIFTYSDDKYSNESISIFDIPDDVYFGVSETYEGYREFDFHGIIGGSPIGCFSDIYKELVRLIGEPSSTGADYDRNIEYVSWEFDGEKSITIFMNIDGVYFYVKSE